MVKINEYYLYDAHDSCLTHENKIIKGKTAAIALRHFLKEKYPNIQVKCSKDNDVTFILQRISKREGKKIFLTGNRSCYKIV